MSGEESGFEGSQFEGLAAAMNHVRMHQEASAMDNRHAKENYREQLIGLPVSMLKLLSNTIVMAASNEFTCGWLSGMVDGLLEAHGYSFLDGMTDEERSEAIAEGLDLENGDDNE